MYVFGRHHRFVRVRLGEPHLDQPLPADARERRADRAPLVRSASQPPLASRSTHTSSVRGSMVGQGERCLQGVFGGDSQVLTTRGSSGGGDVSMCPGSMIGTAGVRSCQRVGRLLAACRRKAPLLEECSKAWVRLGGSSLRACHSRSIKAFARGWSRGRCRSKSRHN